MPLNRLLYVSRCALSATGAERDALVREIAAHSAQRNTRAQLTGSLLHVGNHFVQVLEGPIAAVERTFEAICCDFRHEDVKLIDLVPVRERIFPEWGMAYLGAEGDTSIKLRDDLEEVHFLVGINAREAVGQMRRLLEHGLEQLEPPRSPAVDKDPRALAGAAMMGNVRAHGDSQRQVDPRAGAR